MVKRNQTKSRPSRRSQRVTIPSLPFITTRTALKLTQYQFPNTIFTYTLKDACPDLLAPGHPRSVKLVGARVRYYPVPTPVNKPDLISVQGLSVDLATNSLIPTTPIIPLSTTLPRRQFIRTQNMSFLNTGDEDQLKRGLLAIAVTWTQQEPAASILVDIEFHWRVARDNIYTIPLNDIEIIEEPLRRAVSPSPSISSNRRR